MTLRNTGLTALQLPDGRIAAPGDAVPEDIPPALRQAWITGGSIREVPDPPRKTKKEPD